MRSSARVLSLVVPSLIAGVVLGTVGAGIASSVLGSSVFSDVNPGAFYDDAVGEMYSIGVVQGYANGKFGPNDYVTRGQVAVMMKRLRDEILWGGGAAESSSSVASSVSSSSSSSVSSRSSSRSSAASVAPNAHGVFRFASTTFSIPETVPTITLSILRTSGTSGTAAITYSAKAGTAVAGTSFVEIPESTLTFADGEESKTFSIQIKDDPAATGPRTVLLEIKDPTGDASLGIPVTATLTILDSDSSNAASSSSSQSAASSQAAGTPAIGFSAIAYEVSEDAGTAAITVARTGSTSGDVGVTCSTSNKTAMDGSEYVSTSTVLSFASGETSKTFSVPIIDDTSVDGKKVLNLTLSAPTGGAAIASLVTVPLSISDNEANTAGSGAFMFAKASYSVTFGDGKAVLAVNRVGGTKHTVSVSYATAAGTASASRDFTTTSGTLTFLEGEASKTIEVPLMTESTAAGGVYFTVTLSNPTGHATIDTPDRTVVTIYQ